MKEKVFIFTVFLFVSVLYGAIAKKNNTTDNDFMKIKKTAPKVFIDCDFCDMDYIRENISFVNYVVETREADVYILITIQRTGSRGRKYTIKFKGQKRFENIDDELYYFTSPNDTKDIIRKGLVKKLKMGLLQYVKKTKISDYITINFNSKDKPKRIKDKWNNWLFNIMLNFSQSGETSYKHMYLNYSLNATRVTEKNRINLYYTNYKRITEYIIDNEKIKSDINIYRFKSIYVHGMNEHFSIGGELKVDSSSYYNMKKRFKIAPAIEYNIFPYSKASTKIFRINYSLGFESVKYYETTIYDKDKENLFFQSLETEFEIKQEWGEANFNIDFSQYLHDLKKYNLEFSVDLSWRIMKGISFYTFGTYSVIHDQLYLPKGDLTPEEILLRTTSIETDYNYYIGVGIKISFGSFYNNVVNSRFGY